MRLTSLATALSVGFETLRANPLRTILSTLGVIIGVSALVAVLSVGDGIEQSVRTQIASTTDLQAINIRSRTSEEIDGQYFPIANPARLTLDDAAAIRGVPGVSAVAFMRQVSAEVRAPHLTTRRMAQVSAEVALRDSGGEPTLLAGRQLTVEEAAGSGDQVVVSHDLAVAIAGGAVPAQALGDSIRIGAAQAVVVGVLDATVPAPSPSPRRPAGDYRVVAPVGFMDRIASTASQAPPSSIVAVSGTVEETVAVKSRIERLFAEHEPDWTRRYSITTNERRLEQLSTSILMFKLFLGAITGISLLVGGIGIMNVLLSSVTERTREIGIRKAMGARDRDVKWQFLAESVAISGVGSAIGLVVGVAGAFGITAGIRHFSLAPFLSASVSWSTLVVAAAAALLIGLTFGTYPARRAARLSPIDAIRHE